MPLEESCAACLEREEATSSARSRLACFRRRSPLVLVRSNVLSVWIRSRVFRPWDRLASEERRDFLSLPRPLPPSPPPPPPHPSRV